jgi:hypothetical protein
MTLTAHSLGCSVSGRFDAPLHASRSTMLLPLTLFACLDAARLDNTCGLVAWLLGIWLLRCFPFKDTDFFDAHLLGCLNAWPPL